MGCLFCISFTRLSLSWIEVIECNCRLLCPCTILRAYIWVCASVATDVVAFFISHYLLPRHEPYFLLFTVNVAYSRCTRGTVQRCSSSLEAKFEGSPNTASGDDLVKSVWVDHCPLFNFDNQRPIAVTGRDYFFFQSLGACNCPRPTPPTTERRYPLALPRPLFRSITSCWLNRLAVIHWQASEVAACLCPLCLRMPCVVSVCFVCDTSS